MTKIIRANGSGKTKELIKEAWSNKASIVCKNPHAMKIKIYGYGYTDIPCYYYDEINQIKGKYYIDDLDSFLETIKCSGYNLSTD